MDELPLPFGAVAPMNFVQIITVFSCKLQGKRANKARKLVKELIEDGGEKDDKNNSSNADSK